MEIHQLLPNLTFGDAISNHALEIKRVLRENGYHSNIYVQHSDPAMNKFCYPYESHRGVSSKNNIIIFHYSISSDISRYVAKTPDKKIMIYHNITPDTFFKDINKELYLLTGSGRKELKYFRKIPKLSLAVSEYNAQELRKLGFNHVHVLPVMINLNKFDKRPDKSVLDKYTGKHTNIIFVGRIVPNKKFEDIIKSHYFYKKYLNPASRLFLIGSYDGMETYYNSLKKLIAKLNIDDVFFTGQISDGELIAYYKLANIFLCMSEHEGFNIPLIEAMHFKIPIIAYRSTAIPYTLGKAGVLLREKNYIETAELIDFVLNNKHEREAIVERQLERLSDFKIEKTAKKLLEYIHHA